MIFLKRIQSFPQNVLAKDEKLTETERRAVAKHFELASLDADSLVNLSEMTTLYYTTRLKGLSDKMQDDLLSDLNKITLAISLEKR